MLHHKHPGLAGHLDAAGAALSPHADALRADAQLVWFPITDATGRDVESLEGLTCVPTRAGAMRIVAVPHVLTGLALGDEVAVADWDGEPMARGNLASSLVGTVRVVLAQGGQWQAIAAALDDAAGGPGRCTFDVISEEAVAASVPRDALAAVFAMLNERQAEGALRFEYATAARHA
ncbi:MAG: hypothetical protein JWO69_477 [Thermoleophilia bacterium]|jgi:hypothetical protein|nr:hypothetical protein [Thermoleophilia bacterium]